MREFCVILFPAIYRNSPLFITISRYDSRTIPARFMAYIRPYKSGFRAEVQINGFRKSATFSTKREALEWARIKETEFSAAPSIGARFTIQDAVDKYAVEVSPKKAGTRWELLRLPQFVDHFKSGTLLASIHAPEIAEWRDTRLSKVKAGTVRREAALLRNIFTIAKNEWNWIDSHPFDGVKMPKEPDARYQTWTWQEIKRVVRKLGYVTGKPPETKSQEVALAFMIELRTSLRAAEVLRVSNRTFDAVKRVIVVKAKGKLRSEIPVTKQGAKLCKLANFSISTTTLDVLFRKARDSVLISDKTFHDGRATALTMLARKYDILTLARISQHSDLRMLQRYYRESSADIAKRL